MCFNVISIKPVRLHAWSAWTGMDRISVQLMWSELCKWTADLNSRRIRSEYTALRCCSWAWVEAAQRQLGASHFQRMFYIWEMPLPRLVLRSILFAIKLRCPYSYTRSNNENLAFLNYSTFGRASTIVTATYLIFPSCCVENSGLVKLYDLKNVDVANRKTQPFISVFELKIFPAVDRHFVTAIEFRLRAASTKIYQVA